MCKTKKHIKTYLSFCGYVYTTPLSLKRQCSRGRTLFTWQSGTQSKVEIEIVTLHRGANGDAVGALLEVFFARKEKLIRNFTPAVRPTKSFFLCPMTAYPLSFRQKPRRNGQWGVGAPLASVLEAGLSIADCEVAPAFWVPAKVRLAVLMP